MYIPAMAQVNLVTNGAFTQVTDGKPTGWSAVGNADRVEQKLEAVRDGGKSCGKLTCSRFQGGLGDSHAMLAQVGLVRLEKDKTYEFSCKARAEWLTGRSVSIAISDTAQWANCGLDGNLSLGSAWKEYKRVFKATHSVSTASRLQIWFTETGTLYITDISIVEINLSSAVFTHVASPAVGKNMVPNGSFKLGASGWSSFGIETGWGNMAHLHGSVMTDPDPAHRSFLRIPLGAGRTPMLYFDYLRPVSTPQTRCLAANIGWIPVTVGKNYTVSCDMRASVVDAAALVGVITANPMESWVNGPQGATVKLNTVWKRYSWTFSAYKPYVYVTVGPNLDVDKRMDIDVTNIQIEAGDQATAYESHSPVEIAIEPTAPGGIYTVGEPAAIEVRATNHSATSVYAQVKFTVTNFFDAPVVLAPISNTIPAGSAITRKVAIPAGWRGYYKLTASWSIGAHKESSSLRLAIIPKRSSDDGVLGINHAFPDNQLIKLGKKAGITWYRDWSLKWEDIGPKPGEWKWNATDLQIDRVVKEGVKLMALLPPFPSAGWASEAPDSIQGTGYPEARMREAWAPKDPAGLTEFVTKTANRYKERVRVWEFLNEPLYTDYALPGPGKTRYGCKTYGPADYVSLLKPVSQAIRKNDPTGKIIGGIASGPDHMTHELMEAGMLPLIDIFNLHIYPGARAPEGYIAEMDRFVKDMADHGAKKPIWITEFSYYADDDPSHKPYMPGSGDWAEARLLADERACAEYTVRFFTVMLAHGVEKVFIHSGASGAVNSPNLECCLFNYGGAPRKVMPAMAVYTELLGPHPKCVSDSAFLKDGRVTAFETGSSSVVVVWTVGVNRTLKIKGERLSIMDIMGAVIPQSNISITSTPIFITGPSGKGMGIAEEVIKGIK